MWFSCAYALAAPPPYHLRRYDPSRRALVQHGPEPGTEPSHLEQQQPRACILGSVLMRRHKGRRTARKRGGRERGKGGGGGGAYEEVLCRGRGCSAEGGRRGEREGEEMEQKKEGTGSDTIEAPQHQYMTMQSQLPPSEPVIG